MAADLATTKWGREERGRVRFPFWAIRPPSRWCPQNGQGKRVAQQTTVGGSTTTAAYIGDIEEDATTGGTTTKTSYYYAGGWRFALSVAGVIKYLVSDGLGSANVSLDGTGNVIASILYAPYGSPRYTSGSMPTDRGFTGQISDSNSGLDYYVARYYDPMAAQFGSSDPVLPGKGLDVWGLSRYAYVEGNPIIRSDPSGHCYTWQCWVDVNQPNFARVSHGENVAGGQEIARRSSNDAYQYARTHRPTALQRANDQVNKQESSAAASSSNQPTKCAQQATPADCTAAAVLGIYAGFVFIGVGIGIAVVGSPTVVAIPAGLVVAAGGAAVVYESWQLIS